MVETTVVFRLPLRDHCFFGPLIPAQYRNCTCVRVLPKNRLEAQQWPPSTRLSVKEEEALSSPFCFCRCRQGHSSACFVWGPTYPNYLGYILIRLSFIRHTVSLSANFGYVTNPFFPRPSLSSLSTDVYHTFREIQIERKAMDSVTLAL